MAFDRFGNVVDPAVGYARGRILSDSVAEMRKRAAGLAILSHRLATQGPGAIFNFTGHHREFVADAAAIAQRRAEEWIGQSLVERELRPLASAHLGGTEATAVAVFNRSSACIVAAALAVAAPGRPLVSIAPRRRSHVSIRRAAALAGAALVECEPGERPDTAAPPALVFVTRVTSELDMMDDTDVTAAVAFADAHAAPSFLDDAYAAQLAPMLGRARGLSLGTTAVVTSCDKAGLAGPRAGLLAGEAAFVDRVLAKASEIGLEARAPVVLGVAAALARFDLETVRRDCRVGESLADALDRRLGPGRVVRTPMGPTLPEDEVLAILAARSGAMPALVPCEASALVAMRLAERFGFLTSNVAERPGARVSLRLRALAADVARFGGVERVVEAIDTVLGEVAARDLSADRVAAGLFGAADSRGEAPNADR